MLAPWVVRSVDVPLYDAIGAPDPDPWAPAWFGMYFGRPQVAVPAALLVALFTVRCRVLAVAYPLTIVFGGLLNLGLGALVDKARPPLGAHADQTDSFPSGHAIEVTLLLGLLPLAVAVLLRSPWAGRVAQVIASGTLAMMLVDGVREGSHWPSDHLAGFAIAMTAVVAVHALARMPSLHDSCDRCP
ncbi:MAG: phosphatase PAP2 family protein, partial [Acidimicrobiia bacterium]